MPSPDLRLGVDLGRTNTDAVVMDAGDHLLAKAKVPSTEDGREAIAAAIRAVLCVPGVEAASITRAMLGTRLATTAVLERRGVRRVAVVRIGSPLTHAVPPLWTWPGALRHAVSVGETVVAGGAEYDGRQVAALDEEAIARFLGGVASAVDGVAISGVFASVAPDHELAAADVVRRELGGGVHVSLSHEIGTLGLIERENATVLNAALVGAADGASTVFADTIAAEEIDAEPFLAQNDGSVMAVEHALRFPVLMIRSGAANGMRGAAFLSGAGDGVVVDAGGAAIDVGALVHGYPRESALPAEVAGVRMSFRTPDVQTLPIADGMGPAPAVGAELAKAVDQIGAGRASPTLIAIGGAAATAAEALVGSGDVVRPADGDVAGAIGLVVAPVSGYAERICVQRDTVRTATLAQVRAAAVARAIHAGAEPGGVEVVEVEEVPLSYLRDAAIRIRVRAAGPRS
jgi:N-methylhydantoinase A/oxoprolinase/acetone carboxylase beta subunit